MALGKEGVGGKDSTVRKEVFHTENVGTVCFIDHRHPEKLYDTIHYWFLIV